MTVNRRLDCALGAGVTAGITQGIESLSKLGPVVGKTGDTLSKTVNSLSKTSNALQGVGKFLSQSNFGAGLIRGAVGSAVTQGVAAATGLQDKFSWASCMM